MDKFHPIVLRAFEKAQEKSLEMKSPGIDIFHLLWGFIQDPTALSFRALSSHREEIEKKMGALPSMSRAQNPDESPKITRALESWIVVAQERARKRGEEVVGEEDFLSTLEEIAPEFSVDEKLIETSSHDVPPFLTDLNALARAGRLDPVIGRHREIRALMEILGRRKKNNPILLGPAGVGKTAIVEGLSEAIVKGNVPEILEDRVIYSLDMGALVAGTKFQGAFEERIQKLMDFMKKQGPKAILFVDEIHHLMGAGKGSGGMDGAGLLKPALARGDISCIGATTDSEYQKYILTDGALARRFRAVAVATPTREEATGILMGIRDKMEAHHGIKIADEAILASVFLSDQYMTDKNLPDKAIDLLDEASAALKLSVAAMPTKLAEMEANIRAKKIYANINKEDKTLESEIASLEEAYDKERNTWEKEAAGVERARKIKDKRERYRFEMEQAERQGLWERAGEIKYSVLPALEKELKNQGSVGVLERKHIAGVIARETGIPLEKILRDKQENILSLGPYLKSRVYGQEGPLEEIAQCLGTSYAGLGDASRPLGSFLLKGPSGVGKTETARALAAHLFDNESRLVRFDMSEFSEKHSVAKLIGAPAGYIGYEEGGLLTEALRKNPYSVVLFDEIEKAHHHFSDILLQVLDDGRLTDNRGRRADFKNAIIMLTTNSTSLERDFRPEVLGRLDGILTYNKLDEQILKNLINRELTLLNGKLADKNISLSLDESLYSHLLKKGYDPRYGARPLRAVFKKTLASPLAQAILEGTMKKGAKLRAQEREGEVVFVASRQLGVVTRSSILHLSR